MSDTGTATGEVTGPSISGEVARPTADAAVAGPTAAGENTTAGSIVGLVYGGNE